jgi:2-dehydro-3-deoxyphosphogluconate aldolase / (4S)-4-hydroxy-2-oxoglutarate aldolase
MRTEELLDLGPVIPVVAIEDAAQAVPLARALHEGGLPTVEVTLRTPAALPAIERIASEVPEIVVGAGTITSPGDVTDAREAGAQFLVSPGQTPYLLDAMATSELPYLAGCSGPSDVLALVERGIACAKLFPAEAAGGVAMARALGGPFPQVRLCPTGSIDAANAREYLRLANVPCVGGTWVARASFLRRGEWSSVARLARAAAALPAIAR